MARCCDDHAPWIQRWLAAPLGDIKSASFHERAIIYFAAELFGKPRRAVRAADNAALWWPGTRAGIAAMNFETGRCFFSVCREVLGRYNRPTKGVARESKPARKFWTWWRQMLQKIRWGMNHQKCQTKRGIARWGVLMLVAIGLTIAFLLWEVTLSRNRWKTSEHDDVVTRVWRKKKQPSVARQSYNRLLLDIGGSAWERKTSLWRDIETYP